MYSVRFAACTDPLRAWGWYHGVPAITSPYFQQKCTISWWLALISSLPSLSLCRFCSLWSFFRNHFQELLSWNHFLGTTFLKPLSQNHSPLLCPSPLQIQSKIRKSDLIGTSCQSLALRRRTSTCFMILWWLSRRFTSLTILSLRASICFLWLSKELDPRKNFETVWNQHV